MYMKCYVRTNISCANINALHTHTHTHADGINKELNKGRLAMSVMNNMCDVAIWKWKKEVKRKQIHWHYDTLTDWHSNRQFADISGGSQIYIYVYRSS